MSNQITIQDVTRFITNCQSSQDLKTIGKALKYAHGHIQTIKTLEFKKGDTVQFKSKHGERIDGIVERTNQKTVTVNAGINGLWRVAPSFLTKV